MSNERKTESIVEKLLNEKGFEDILEFQGSSDKNIQSLLKSKSSKLSGRGKPEFLIKLNGISSDLIIIECKKSSVYHSSGLVVNKLEFNSEDKLSPVDYAEDGVIHYMLSLSKFYNVIGIAISGTTQLKITTFITSGQSIERTVHTDVLSKDQYIKLLKTKDYAINDTLILENISKELPLLHNDLRVKMKLSEQEKPLLISAILIALNDEIFKCTYKMCHEKNELTKLMVNRIEQSLIDRNLSEEKINIMMTNFSFIKTNDNLKSHLKYILDKLMFLFDQFNFSNTNFDIIGSFYNEFLKYVGGDKQNLGIVLTPKHITEFFCDLADINTNSVVLDPCSGTGGFLISAMKKMIDKSNGNENLMNHIKLNNLIGVEQNSQMFTLTCANMILRDDGKSNIFNGSCFDEKIKKEIIRLKPNIVFMNPPYSQKENFETELDFINNALDLLENNGKLITIVPMSTAIELTKTKIDKRDMILKKHTLDAVFSMPDELFYPVGTVTCIMIFIAHKPHSEYHKTFFSYFKDDGFEKSKVYGRYDKNKQWGNIKKHWLDIYLNRDDIDGLSIKKTITAVDEWCCEAYMNIDYSTITITDFEDELKKYIAFQIMNKNILKEGFL